MIVYRQTLVVTDNNVSTDDIVLSFRMNVIENGAIDVSCETSETFYRYAVLQKALMFDIEVHVNINKYVF